MSVPLVNDNEIKIHFGPQANIQDCFNLPKKITGTAEYTGPSHIQRQDLTTGSRRFSPLCIRGPAIALVGVLIGTAFLISGFVFINKALSEEGRPGDFKFDPRTYIRLLKNGIVFMSIGAVSCLASCIFGCVSSARKEKVQKDLEQEILPTAKEQAIARINALNSPGSPPPY